MLGDVALHEQGGPFGIDADGEQELGELEGSTPQFDGILGNRESVEVDHAEDGLGVILISDPVAQRPEEVPELHWSGGLDAGEDTSHGRRC